MPKTAIKNYILMLFLTFTGLHFDNNYQVFIHFQDCNPFNIKTVFVYIMPLFV